MLLQIIGIPAVYISSLTRPYTLSPQYNKEKIVSMYAGSTSRYGGHVISTSASALSEDDGKTKVDISFFAATNNTILYFLLFNQAIYLSIYL